MGEIKDLPLQYVANCPTGGPLEVTGTVETSEAAVGTPNHHHESMATAGNEYTYTLPAGTKRFYIAFDKGFCVLTANTADTSEGTDIPPGAGYGEKGLDPTKTYTLRFTSDKNSDIAKVWSWS